MPETELGLQHCPARVQLVYSFVAFAFRARATVHNGGEVDGVLASGAHLAYLCYGDECDDSSHAFHFCFSCGCRISAIDDDRDCSLEGHIWRHAPSFEVLMPRVQVQPHVFCCARQREMKLGLHVSHRKPWENGFYVTGMQMQVGDERRVPEAA